MTSTTLMHVRRKALLSLIPPQRQALSTWIERELRLPEGTALSGAVELWPFQREIADAITDPGQERVTLVKPVQVGFTTLLVGAIGNFVANEPSQTLVVLPTEADCRNFVVSEIEPVFQATPALNGVLASGQDDRERNTLMHRLFPGGSLKVVAAKSPRNLRSHKARVLLMDEVDAMEVSAEGSPIRLAENRTVTFRDRKIVLGSTPVDTDTSLVLASWADSDQRVFECPCPKCGVYTEIQWSHIEWEKDEAGHHRPETAVYRCPACSEITSERQKPAMVAKGVWRKLRPEVEGHAGFRLNALVSPAPNVAWPKLVREFLEAKRQGPEQIKVFVNTKLGQGWDAGGSEFDHEALRKGAEDFGWGMYPGQPDRPWVPREVLLVTSGTDVQEDRLETSFIGFARDGDIYALDHHTIWGSPEDDGTWAELDELLRSRTKHPRGGTIGISASVVDSGAFTDEVYAFTAGRLHRHIMAGKGMAGARPAQIASQSKTKGARIWIIGVDTIKARIFNRLTGQPQQAIDAERIGGTIRFSRLLAEEQPQYFEQVCSEKRVIKYTRGQPQRIFERKAGARAEALDCMVYAIAARETLRPQWDVLEKRLAQVEEKRSRISDWSGRFHGK